MLLFSQQKNNTPKLTKPRGHQLNGANDRALMMPATKTNSNLIGNNPSVDYRNSFIYRDFIVCEFICLGLRTELA